MNLDCSAVLDVGKTHVKLRVFDAQGQVIEQRDRPNHGVSSPQGYTALDTNGIEAWLWDSLASLTHRARISHLIVTTHGAHIQALLDLLGQSTDGSNLTLDPDIDTYYLMDASMFRLPVMMEAASQIRSLGAAVLGAGSATPAQTRRLVEQATLLSSHQAAPAAGQALGLNLIPPCRIFSKTCLVTSWAVPVVAAGRVAELAEQPVPSAAAIFASISKFH